jgi:protein-export membrane protein SecD/preprotein translocase SecF subunit
MDCMGTMIMLRWQLLVLGCTLLIGVTALFRRRVLWFRACVAGGLLLAFALQLLVTPLGRRIASLDRTIASLPDDHPDSRALAQQRAAAETEQRKATGLERLPFRLGLDLRGGTEIRLRLHPDQSRIERLREEQRELAEKQASSPTPERQMAISSLADSISREETRLEDQLAQAVDIVRHRLSGIGVSDIAVMRDGRDRILIQLPDMNTDEAEAVVQTVEQQGVLAFRMIVPRTGAQGQPSLYAAIESQGFGSDTRGLTAAGTLPLDAEHRDHAPFDWLRTPDTATEGGDLRRGYFRVVQRTPVLTGSRIIAARHASDHRGENWRVQVEFDAEGSQRFLETTRDNLGRQLGIVLDGRLVSAPYIGEVVDEGRTEIIGDFAEREARNLAVILQSGALKVRVSRESQTRIGPSLGEDSIRRGVRSLAAGFLAVVLFMALYYRVAGLIAVSALLANMLILAAILSALDSAVALPGIAGAILLVGITVDSAVLIYERLREEQKSASSTHNIVHAAYDRAFTTIVDTNVTTILAAGILYVFAADAVKGFCLVLVIGILTGLFCSLVGIRWMLDGLAELRPSARLRMMPPPRCPTIDFVKCHRRAAGTSLVLIVGSALLFAWMYHRGDAFGTEFTGGIRVRFRLSQAQRVEVVRQRIQSTLGDEYPDAAVTLRSHGRPQEGALKEAPRRGALGGAAASLPADAEAGVPPGRGQRRDQRTLDIPRGPGFEKSNGNSAEPLFSEFSLSAQQVEDGSDSQAISVLTRFESAIRDAFATERTRDEETILAASQMGPLVAGEMRRATSTAIALALGAIFLYIFFRFRMHGVFGWVAVLTLAHDVIITLGLLLLGGRLGLIQGQIDLKVSAALLTTIGYSLNDTIVVFDRIRENARGDAISPETINKSINQVLLRTLVTSFTTLLVVVALFVLGGEVIRGFAFTLLIGIVVGTYSSIFMAGPMVGRPWSK